MKHFLPLLVILCFLVSSAGNTYVAYECSRSVTDTTLPQQIAISSDSTVWITSNDTAHFKIYYVGRSDVNGPPAKKGFFGRIFRKLK